MIDILLKIENDLKSLIENLELKSMHIDYHPPFVNRIWFQHEDYRVYLHKIFPCIENYHALYHPHPWKSAIRILKGKYEMGIGNSSTDSIPTIDCKLIVSSGTIYEMIEKDGWHYVNPISEPSFSLMVTGEKYDRKMPILPEKRFRSLNNDESAEILDVFKTYYDWESFTTVLKIN